MQFLIVAIVVAACFVYAAWTLMPAAARRWSAQRLLAWPLPAFALDRLRRQAEAASGCGCDGCDKSVQAKNESRPAVTPITFHPPRRP